MLKTNIILIFFSVLILNFFKSIFCKSSNEDISEAMSCMTLLVQKLKGDQLDPKTYSSKLLKCFITITEDEAKEILVAIEQGMKSIEPEEIERLTDTSTLQDIPKDELSNNSLRLEEAIKEFRKLQEKYASRNSGKSTSDDDDEDYRKAHPSRGNSLGSFMKKFTKFLKIANSMGSIIIVIIFLYFFSILFKNCCKKNKSKSKSNDKTKEKKVKKKNE